MDGVARKVALVAEVHDSQHHVGVGVGAGAAGYVVSVEVVVVEGGLAATCGGVEVAVGGGGAAGGGELDFVFGAAAESGEVVCGAGVVGGHDGPRDAGGRTVGNVPLCFVTAGCPGDEYVVESDRVYHEHGAHADGLGGVARR